MVSRQSVGDSQSLIVCTAGVGVVVIAVRDRSTTVAGTQGHGLIAKVDEAGYYELTAKGRAYLEGELDVSELEVDE